MFVSSVVTSALRFERVCVSKRSRIEASPVSAAGAPANFVTSPTLVLLFGRTGGHAAVLGTRVWIYGGINQLGQADTEMAELR